MQKYLTWLMSMAFIGISFLSNAQYDSTKNRQVQSSYGFDWKNGKFGSIVISTDTVKMALKDSGAIAYKAGSLWVYNGSSWNLASSGVITGPGGGPITITFISNVMCFTQPGYGTQCYDLSKSYCYSSHNYNNTYELHYNCNGVLLDSLAYPITQVYAGDGFKITDTLGTGKLFTVTVSGGGSGGGDSILSIQKNATRDSVITSFLSGRRIAVKDSVGASSGASGISKVTGKRGIVNLNDSTIALANNDSIVYVYPGDRLQTKLNQVPAFGKLKFTPGYFIVPLDTLGAAMAITRSNLTVEIPSGTYIKIKDSTNAPIDSVEINRNYTTVSGLDDISARSTTSPPTLNQRLLVAISATGSPNQFKVNGGGAINITGGWQAIGVNVEVKFNATTGHNLNDAWYLLTGSTPAVFLKIGQGFQTDTIRNTKIFGGGTIDGNKAKEYPVNYLGSESNYTIGILGKTENTVVDGLTLINGERPVFASGRTTATFNNNGTVTGGVSYDVNGLTISNTTCIDNYSGILLGHPSYRGYVKNVIVNKNYVRVSTAEGVPFEPNTFLSGFAAIDNTFINDVAGISMHLWRGPEKGSIEHNNIVGQILDGSPGQWYRTRSVNVQLTDNNTNTTTTTALKIFSGFNVSGSGIAQFKSLDAYSFLSFDNSVGGGETGLLLKTSGNLLGQLGARESDNAIYFKNRIYGASDMLTLKSNGQVIVSTPLVVNSSITTAYVAKTVSYTATLSDHTINCTANTFNVILPTAVGNAGLEYEIVNSGAGTITVATTSSQKFVNVTATPTTLTMSTIGTRVVKSDGANWMLISSL